LVGKIFMKFELPYIYLIKNSIFNLPNF